MRLQEDERGGVGEFTVYVDVPTYIYPYLASSRMKTLSSHPQIVAKDLPASRMRIIAASATLPNARDIGESWMYVR